MYPREFFDTYWRPGLKAEVFVAMPFADEFTSVWKEAIQPAIEQDTLGEYVAHRVDITTLSGSIITEILDAVAHATLVFADISIMRTGRWAGQRNGNVMYEVGLARAIRPNTDVILVKSDTEEISFDVSGIRTHQYPRDNTGKSRKLFATLAESALAERGKIKDLQLQRAIASLDGDCLSVFFLNRENEFFHIPVQEDIPNLLHTLPYRAAVTRMLQMGILYCDVQNHNFAYHFTDFGKQVRAEIEGLSPP